MERKAGEGSRVRGGRAMATAALVVAALAGCAAAPTPTATVEGPAAATERLVHVHEFPSSGRRLAPPTGRPALTWQQAVRSSAVRGHFGSDPPPEVRLAGYTSTAHDPVRQALVWVAVDPDHPLLRIGGPDFGPGYAGGPDACPLYVVVDATSGRGYGAWQSCDPPYRG